MQFYQMIDVVPGMITPPAQDVTITAPVAEDSRQVEPGSVFVARRGDTVDGHEFIAAAVAAGAAAVVGELPPEAVDTGGLPYAHVHDGQAALAWLCAAYYGFPARDLVMVGVTGTDGKTTTTHLIHHILQTAGIKAGMVSTLKAFLGGAEAPTGLHVTTPTAPQVQAYLAQMVRAGLSHCVLETTSHGLAQRRVDACAFDVAVLTNVTHEHLDFHGDWEAYRDAKARLFGTLGTAARKPGVDKWAILNRDDTAWRHFLGASGHERAFTYSATGDNRADMWAADVHIEPDRTRFVGLSIAGGVQFETRLVGKFNVANILAAAGAARALGIDPLVIRRAVASALPVPGRMERIDDGQDFLALVDFAHTPNALRRALEAARLMAAPGGRVIAVFGSAGLRDRAKRRLMAELGADLADITVLTAEDPRTESLEDILAEMAAGCAVRGGVEGETFWRVADRGEALALACSMARAGDVVIGCGKGHEQSMCFGDVEYPWDDRDALRVALQGQPLQTLPTASGRAN